MGKAKAMDRITKDTCRYRLGRIGFATILIKMDDAKKLLDMVTICMPSEESVEPKPVSVRVDYQRRPSHCGRCRVFGHMDELCSHQPKNDERGSMVDSGKNAKGDGDGDGFKKISRRDRS